jgi:hypothetical protein
MTVQVRVAVAVGVMLLAVPAAVADDCAGFGAAQTYAMGDAPYSVASADFNRDGYVDFAVANRSSNNVGVRLGGAFGALAAQVTYTTGLQPSYVFAGDLNQDGKADLATANNGSSTVSVLLGQGNGTFAAAVNYAVGTAPFTVAAADINRDGWVDLLSANRTGGSISTLRGTANGFSSYVAVPATDAVFVAIGDFNGDTIPDLAAARFEADVVTIFLGNGNATFGAGTDLVSADTPRAIGVGDFDRDGDADLAVVNQDGSNVKIFTGAGNGTFAAGTTYPAGTLPHSVAVTDFTGDGKLDLAVANSGTDDVSFLAGNGDGTFDAAIQVGAGDGPRGVIGVVQDSGQLPVLVIANELSDNLTLRAGASFCTTNCGQYAAAVSEYANASPRQAAVADFNRDGKPDLVVPESGSTTVRFLHGNGNGGFSTGGVMGATAPESVAVGDFNRDGITDVAVAQNHSLLIVRHGAADGTYPGTASPNLGSASIDIATADFNLDGKLDLAALRASGASAVGTFLGSGTGSFGSVYDVNVTATAPKALTIADLNRDGKPDIVTANGGHSSITVALGNGDGSFTVLPYHIVGGNARDVVITDMNKDGKPDAVVARGTNTLMVLFGAGDGTFSSSVTTTLTGDPYGLTVVENEYYPTVLAALETTSELARVSYLADSSEFIKSTFTAGTGAAAVAAVDLNRDGRLDAVVSNISATNISILLNYCSSEVQLETSANPSYSPPVFTATVGGASALIGPTGTVTFKDGDAVLATVGLSGAYEAAYHAFAMTIGSHPITATYNGDSIYAPSTSEVLNQTIALGPPSNVYSAPSGGGTTIQVAWSAASYAQSYDVYRSTNNAAFAFLANTTSTSYTDSTVNSFQTVYVYRVRSRKDATESALSYPGATQLGMFVDETLVPGTTMIRRIHVIELRTRIDYYRAAAGLESFAFAEPNPVIVKNAHFQELRTALDQAYTALGMIQSPPLLNITPQVTKVQATHLTTLRNHIRSAPFGGPP